MACFVAARCTDKNQGIFLSTFSSSQSLIPQLAKSSRAKWSSPKSLTLTPLCLKVLHLFVGPEVHGMRSKSSRIAFGKSQFLGALLPTSHVLPAFYPLYMLRVDCSKDKASSPHSTPLDSTNSNFRVRVYEILASIISLAMLAAIFGVLRHYNSTDVALWSHSWSLNSLVGLLATISQISMAVPLTSGISQLKWVWYKDSQKLSDLDKFDQSSRGPMGSAKLLFSRPFK
jgi:hypothetical protein